MSRGREKIYFVGGVNGVGKSSFLSKLSSKHSEFKVFWGSAEFMKWLRLKQGDYRGLRDLSDTYKDLELDKMMKVVLQKGAPKNKTLIIDAHYLNYKKGKVVDATGLWMSLLDALFIVSASPETILKRLKNDKKIGRSRNLLPWEISQVDKITLINKFLRLTLEKAQEISKKYKIPYFVIDNNDNGLDRAIEEFLRYDSVIIKKHAQ